MEQSNKPNKLSLTLANLGLFLYSTMEIVVFVVLAVILIIVFIINFTANPMSPDFQGIAEKLSDPNQTVLISIASQFAAYLIIASVLILVLRKKANLKESLGLNGFDPVTLLLVLATAFITVIAADIFGLFADFIFSLLGVPIVEPPGIKELFEGPQWLLIFSVCIMAPLFEEFFFRGVIYSGYSKRYGVIKAALFSGLLFALIHGYIPSVIAIIPVGFIFGLLVGYSKSLYLTIIAHAAYNGLLLLNFIDDIVLFPVNLLNGAVADVSQVVWLLILLPICGVLIFYIMREIKRRSDIKYPQEQIFAPKEQPVASTVFFVLSICLMGISCIFTNLLAYEIDMFNIFSMWT